LSIVASKRVAKCGSELRARFPEAEGRALTFFAHSSSLSAPRIVGDSLFLWERDG